MAILVVDALEQIRITQQQRDRRTIALAARQRMGGQGFKVAAVGQAGQRVLGGLLAQAAPGNQDGAPVNGRQRCRHGKHQADVHPVHDLDAAHGQWIERAPMAAQCLQAQVIRQQGQHHGRGIPARVGDHDGGDEQQQVIVKSAVPANQQRSQCRVPEHLHPDQHQRGGVVALLDEAIGPQVHGNAQEIDDGQGPGAQPHEQQDVSHVDSRCNQRHPLQRDPVGLAHQAGATLRFQGRNRNGSGVHGTKGGQREASAGCSHVVYKEQHHSGQCFCRAVARAWVQRTPAWQPHACTHGAVCCGVKK